MTTSTISTTKSWESKRTPETRAVAELLQKTFAQADAYRYNSASIRVRVIDERFEGMPREKRDTLVEERPNKLPTETQRNIVTPFTFAPAELAGIPKTFRESMLNTEFVDPPPHCFDQLIGVLR